MYKIFILIILLSASTYAVNITIQKNDIASYGNTDSDVIMLNITISSDNPVTIDSVNISTSNLTGINAVKIIDENRNQIGINSSLTNTNIYINLNTPITISNDQPKRIEILYETNNNAKHKNLSITNVSFENVTITDPIENIVYIQDVNADAKIFPKFVDTNVKTQKFLYSLNITGDDEINKTLIYIPNEYTNINITEIKINDSIIHNNSKNCNCFTLEQNIINIDKEVQEKIEINFTMDTPKNPITSKIKSNISGSNLLNIETKQIDNLETKQLLNIKNINHTNFAMPNESWEVDFEIEISENLIGCLQFKMDNWKSGNYTLNLKNENRNFLTLNFKSQEINVSNDYDDCINITEVVTQPLKIKLKMLIPLDYKINSSSGWKTSYSMLFRSDINDDE